MRVDTGRLRVVDTAERSEAGPRRKRRPVPIAEPPTTEEPEQRSPGPYIQYHRKRKAMSLDQLAALTKIPRAQLELLEADRYDELPGMVFAKGFMRCCARALELDADVVLGLLYARERERLRARRRETSAMAVDARPVARKQSRGGSVQAWLARWISRLPSARILMWLVVALIVALIVLIAFTLASAQAETMIRS